MADLGTLNAASPLDSSDDSRLLFTNDTDAEVLSRALDDTPANFNTMTSLNWTVEYRQQGRTDDTLGLNIRIVNGATILAAADSGGTFASINADIQNTTDTSTGPTAFAYVDTSANKATWDGASVELRQDYSKNMAGDGCHVEVDLISITGVYVGGYTITADSGSYTETGTAANPEFGRLIDALVGAFTETGTAASLEFGRAIDALAGSYTETGTAASLEFGRAIDALAGAFTETGTAAGLEFGRRLEALAGAYTWTGTAATLSRGRTLTAEGGSVTETGSAATLLATRILDALAGAYTETGTAASLELGRIIAASTTSYAWTGSEVTLTYTPGGGGGDDTTPHWRRRHPMMKIGGRGRRWHLGSVSVGG